MSCEDAEAAIREALARRDPVASRYALNTIERIHSRDSSTFRRWRFEVLSLEAECRKRSHP